MKSRFLHLWREHRMLLIGFLLVLTLTSFFLIRTFMGAIYFRNHPDQPIKPWMPIGFIARSYDVPPDVLLRAAGIPRDGSIRRRIRRIAQDTGIPYDVLVHQLQTAIQEAREARAAE